MKLTKLKIKNFRTYQEEITIELDNLTAFVGKNDSGKSTILEALDIFFNSGNGTIKLDKDDINKECLKKEDDEIIISACFSDLPSTVRLDATNETSLESEFLCNDDGELEIIKKYKSAGKEKVFIKAKHPSNIKCNDLLSMKNNELKKIIDSEKITCENKSINSIMRKAIWNNFKDDLQLSITEIDVTKGDDVKSIWGNLKDYLPLYTLFQSDRPNTDSDNEVQDPLKSAVDQIFSNDDVKAELDKISEQVTSKLKDVAEGTLSKLKEINPNLASTLVPKIPEKLDWKKVFNGLSILSNDDIPINKRGSGVRRLILLSFFQSEADKKKNENSNRGIIYAIEEPETSQHFEHQRILINALKSLSQNENTQIIMTTHSSSVVKNLGFDNIRLICKNEETQLNEVRKIEKNYLPTPSLNEVNYFAFGEILSEYHDELYGYLQIRAIDEDDKNTSQNRFDNWLKNHGCVKEKIWIKVEKNGSINSYNFTLPTYIRNRIHHPENTNNSVETTDEIHESIIALQNIVSSLI